jgi:hypothetical protein
MIPNSRVKWLSFVSQNWIGGPEEVVWRELKDIFSMSLGKLSK